MSELRILDTLTGRAEARADREITTRRRDEKGNRKPYSFTGRTPTSPPKPFAETSLPAVAQELSLRDPVLGALLEWEYDKLHKATSEPALVRDEEEASLAAYNAWARNRNVTLNRQIKRIKRKQRRASRADRQYLRELTEQYHAALTTAGDAAAAVGASFDPWQPSVECLTLPTLRASGALRGQAALMAADSAPKLYHPIVGYLIAAALGSVIGIAFANLMGTEPSALMHRPVQAAIYMLLGSIISVAWKDGIKSFWFRSSEAFSTKHARSCAVFALAAIAASLLATYIDIELVSRAFLHDAALRDALKGLGPGSVSARTTVVHAGSSIVGCLATVPMLLMAFGEGWSTGRVKPLSDRLEDHAHNNRATVRSECEALSDGLKQAIRAIHEVSALATKVTMVTARIADAERPYLDDIAAKKAAIHEESLGLSDEAVKRITDSYDDRDFAQIDFNAHLTSCVRSGIQDLPRTRLQVVESRQSPPVSRPQRRSWFARLLDRFHR